MGAPRKTAAASQPAAVPNASRPQAQTRAAASTVVSHCTPWAARSGANSMTRANSISFACGKTGKRRSTRKGTPPDSTNPRAKGRWYIVASNAVGG